MSTETATDNGSMQDAATKLEGMLFPESEQDEPIATDDDEGLDDEAEELLPDDADSDSDDDEGSDEDDLDEIAEGEDLTLAGHLGLDDDRITVDEDGGVMFNAIIDGETKQVPLKDLAANYQLTGHVNNKSMALETEKKEFEEVKQKVATELKQRVQGVSQLAELAEQELVAEYNNIDWNALRHDDPANWTAMRQEYAEKAQKIQQVKDLSLQETKRLDQEQNQKLQEQSQEYNKKELASLIADNPEFADAAVRKEKLGEMSTFIERYGFSAEDAAGISDHRLIRMIKDAQAYRNGKKAAETKRVGKKLPKFQKPGGNRKNATSLAKARKAKALKAKVKNGGHVNDIAASLVDRM